MVFKSILRPLIFCASILLLISCGGVSVGTKSVSYPNPETSEARAAYTGAEQAYLAGDFATAGKLLADFITTYPYTELTDKARFLEGEMAFSRGDYDQAISFYKQSFTQIYSPNVGPKAKFKIGLSLYKQQKYAEAAAELSSIERVGTSPLLRLRIDSAGFAAAREGKLPKGQAITWSLWLIDDYAEGAGYNAAKIPSEDIIPEARALEEVRSFISDESIALGDTQSIPMDKMKGKKSGGYIEYKKALLLQKSGDTADATAALKAFMSRYPKHEYYDSARALLNEMGGVVGELKGMAVGAILPLTGKYGEYGNSVLHGMECALGIYAPCEGPSGIRIIVKDSSLLGFNATAAVADLAAQGVIAIVGPLMSREVTEAAVKANELGVPMISLSQKGGVAEIGDYIFRNYVSPDSEISTLTDYLFGHTRMKRFFILYPENLKGQEYKDLFIAAVEKWGGKITGKFAYAPNQMEFAGELRGRGLAENMATVASGGGYDAIFIPDSFGVVGYLVPTLALMGMRDTKYLGISRWDDPQLVERGGEFVEGAIFVDSFFKQSSDPLVSSFVTKFKSSYDIDPTLLEAMGYDSMRMLVAAMQNDGASERPGMLAVLKRVTGFPGVTGRITFDESGNARRDLTVLTVKDGKIEQSK
jgi:ABC-type branched-subunit amino acid transport system substrate-binding protein